MISANKLFSSLFTNPRCLWQSRKDAAQSHESRRSRKSLNSQQKTLSLFCRRRQAFSEWNGSNNRLFFRVLRTGNCSSSLSMGSIEYTTALNLPSVQLDCDATNEMNHPRCACIDQRTRPPPALPHKHSPTMFVPTATYSHNQQQTSLLLVCLVYIGNAII